MVFQVTINVVYQEFQKTMQMYFFLEADCNSPV